MCGSVSAPFSVRLVAADYYLSPPIPDLDVAFSEFRGCEVKQVPVLRIFGSTPQGNKTCLHIHGVFPYLYIPCNDPKPEPKMAYQIANSIDKALNISLKQTNSSIQHVYKVILVQGIPFYGFHTKPHQFYKIFLYNPVFVKRLADLLQNGAILGLSYQPHEAHINFTMQFFLDFNLYGMSYVNMRNVKFRRKIVDGQVESLSLENENIYLPDSVNFTSRCELEADCLAQNILNRNDVINGKLGANPGLEALWEDEKARRKNLDMSETLGPTQSQVRDNIPATNSHIHNSKRLLVKLALNSEANENSESNLTLSILNDSETSSPHSKFQNNLSKLVYPAESPSDSQMLNATYVMLHHPSYISKTCVGDSNIDAFVDESVVMLCSQNLNESQVILNSEDMEFMELLKDMDYGVEEDSILGSQIPDDCEDNEETAPQETVDHDEELRDVSEHETTLVLNVENESEDAPKDEISSDDNLAGSPSPSVWNDTFWDNVQNISQLDGAWDDPAHEDDKKSRRKLRVGLSRPVRRSIRHVESEPIPIPKSPKVKTPVKSQSMSPKCLRINSKIESFQNEFQCGIIISPKKSPTKRRKRISSLKIFQESPPFRENNGKFLTQRKNLSDTKISSQSKCNSVESDEIKVNGNIKMNPGDGVHNSVIGNGVDVHCISSDDSVELVSPNEPLLMDLDTPIGTKKTLTSSQYDRENKFIPQPGSSKVCIKDSENSNDDLKSSSEISTSFNETYSSPNPKIDLGIISFYDTTLYQDRTVVEIKNDEESMDESKNDEESMDESKNDEKNIDEFKNDKESIDESKNIVLHYDTSPENSDTEELAKTLEMPASLTRANYVVLAPKIDPPSYDYVVSTLDEYGIPHHRNEQPFYSDYKDVGHQIEVGQIVLKLKSRTLADVKPFETHVKGLKSIDQWREEMFMKNAMSQTCEINDLKTFLATNRRCVLTPAISPPSRESVTEWLSKREEENIDQCDDIVPDKITYCLPVSPGQELNASQMDTISLSPLSCTPDSITYSPVIDRTKETPANKSIIKKRKSNKNNGVRKLRPRSLRLSLSQSVRKSIESSLSPLPSSQGSTDSSELFPCGQDVNVSSGEDKQGRVEFTQRQNELEIDQKDATVTDKEEIQNTISFNTTLGFKFSGENYQNALAIHEHEYLTIFVLEVLTSTRGEMTPDPEHDSVLAIFYCVTNDCPKNHRLPQRESGFIFIKTAYDETAFSHFEGLDTKHCVSMVDDEATLFQETLNLILKWDPDILCGYEVEMFSWGYLVQRGCVLNINMSSEISRVPQVRGKMVKKSSQEVMNKEVKLVGRIMLDVWRLMRHEIALTSYSFENIMYHVMHERVAKFSFKTLYFWWNHTSGLLRSLSIEYYLTRVIGVVNILHHLDLIGRTSELARLFGIQWYEVLSRGSQFRVESMMIRMTRPRNYVLVSPSIQQRAAMKAPECIPLVMEPESRFYNDPVIVLDFQSLYPSMMIAYNYCFSTCLGKVNNMGRDTPFELGCSQLKVSPKMLERLHKKDLINWSPCGVGFVKKEVRCGVLPTMLQDILGTRLMVKKAMKKHKEDKTLQKVLHSRQLGLKLISNVTYGYTAANFSGRMPCIEVGDSVVSKGRETLERAIKLVENTPKWKARVVYGDTDSIFVMVPGRSRSQAFDIGAEIAEAVTSDNPTPVKLKLEKVYQPCILQTKKRYVGYMYESKDQKNPVYDAKGIETVRRDGCPATAKMLEKSLRILFETLDMSRVKSYICREFQKILEGRCNIKDFMFAKEFRGINSYKAGAAIPALEIARQLKSVDPRSEPRESERVAYVVVCGAPGESLMRLARPPLSLLSNPSLQLHYWYYISRQIVPPLNRCLTLVGADVNQWLIELPRKQYQLYPLLNHQGKETEGKKNTISQYFSKINCPGCETLTTQGLCEDCMMQPQKTMVSLHNRVNSWQRRHLLLKNVCQSCCGRSRNIECVSIDCPVLFTRSEAQHHVEQVPFIHKMMEKLITTTISW